MEKKKRLYFLIVPAVCIYVAAITFVIIGSASRNPVEPRKLTKPAIGADAAEASSPAQAETVEIIAAEDTEIAEKLLGKDMHKTALKNSIPEFMEYNIVECEVL